MGKCCVVNYSNAILFVSFIFERYLLYSKNVSFEYTHDDENGFLPHKFHDVVRTRHTRHIFAPERFFLKAGPGPPGGPVQSSVDNKQSWSGSR